MKTSINSGSSSSEHNLIMSWIGAADKKINMIIYDTEGTVKFITTSYAQRFNSPSWETMIGRKLSDSIPADDTELQSFVVQLETIRQKVVQDKKLYKYITIVMSNAGLDAYMEYHFPIVLEDGAVQASQVISKIMKSYYSESTFKEHITGEKPTRSEPASFKTLPPSLTTEEYELLFLLNIGFTQAQAAEIYGISRSKLAKIINYKIAAKFDISNNTLKSILREANNLNMFTTIPRKFLTPQVIPVNNFELNLSIFK